MLQFDRWSMVQRCTIGAAHNPATLPASQLRLKSDEAGANAIRTHTAHTKLTNFVGLVAALASNEFGAKVLATGRKISLSAIGFETPLGKCPKISGRLLEGGRGKGFDFTSHPFQIRRSARTQWGGGSYMKIERLVVSVFVAGRLAAVLNLLTNVSVRDMLVARCW